MEETKMTESISLDDFMESNGESFDDSKNVLVSSDDVFDKKKLAYDDADILPGQKTKFDSADDVALNERQAQDKIINDLAMEKLRLENERRSKLSDEAKIRDFIFETEMRRAVNQFYINNHYEMPGKQKRNIKRQIERAYKNGKYKLTDEQKQDILYELNKASNDIKEQNKHALDGKEPVTSLESLISPI